MFIEEIDKIIMGLQELKCDLIAFETRISQLEAKQNKDDTFFRELEKLVKDRNGSY